MESIYPHLAKICKPADLHRLSLKELREVADEVRRAILEQVSKTGGHFSSNLGTVELTVAMYATYSLPPDKVVWDTGHQAYPHKILTGRLGHFPTLRKYRGLSGFLKREENECDAFGAGHAGTAISAALGFAAARDRLGTNERVVAVTGDAAICSGMSWEALNHAGDLGTDLTVVLNDNRMSIAPNVGALTNYLASLRSRPWLQEMARRAKGVVQRMPDPITKMASGLRHGITHYMAPEQTGTIFEEIGWEYIGPVDGHDLPLLIDVFRNVRELPGPVFVHAITVKGKGYDVSEDDARKYHAVVPFDLEVGQMVSVAGPKTFTQAFGEAALECAEVDPKVVAITAAMPDGTGLTRFAKTFPDRFYDVGIAEEHAVTFAAGMAAAGMKPFCAIYSTFLQRGFDQILHDVCIQHLPVRFFVDRAGLVGDDGPTHHGAFDLSFLSMIPGMVVMAPRDGTELREMTQWVCGYESGPTAIRYPRGSESDRLPEHRTPIELGKAEVLTHYRNDVDVCLIGVGNMTAVAWDAAQMLKAMGIRASVVNARFVKPLDEETLLHEARRARAVITIEENAPIGGFGSLVRDALHRAELGGLPHRLMALPDEFVEHGPQSLLRSVCSLDVEAVILAAQELVGVAS